MTSVMLSAIFLLLLVTGLDSVAAAAPSAARTASRAHRAGRGAAACRQSGGGGGVGSGRAARIALPSLMGATELTVRRRPGAAGASQSGGAP